MQEIETCCIGKEAASSDKSKASNENQREKKTHLKAISKIKCVLDYL